MDPGRRSPADSASYFAMHIFICTNRRPDGHARGSCAARGSERLLRYMKSRTKELGIPDIRINSAGCLDRCELGPCLVVYPEGIWYRVGSEAEIDLVLTRHLLDGDRVPDLMLPGRG